MSERFKESTYVQDCLCVVEESSVSASAAEATTCRNVLHLTRMGAFGFLFGICGAGGG